MVYYCTKKGKGESQLYYQMKKGKRDSMSPNTGQHIFVICLELCKCKWLPCTEIGQLYPSCTGVSTILTGVCVSGLSFFLQKESYATDLKKDVESSKLKRTMEVAKWYSNCMC